MDVTGSITGSSLLDVIIVAGAVASALVGIGVLVRRSVRTAARFARWCRRVGIQVDKFFDDWRGAPGAPSVTMRLSTIETTVDAVDQRLTGVEAELRPNHGSSLRDSTDRLERDVGHLGFRLDRHLETCSIPSMRQDVHVHPDESDVG